MSDFTVFGSYNGYIFVGCAQGNFEASRDGQKLPYYNMYVLSPVSSWSSEDYEASGWKAEKKKCISSDVWKGLDPGDHVMLFFDDKGRVIQAGICD